ncbi:MAG TPA: P-loop NTPase fold protein [Nostocaceae cyanobacterium]|nr:P-loop NTPase fold protein [Nostocaceae cyanobacterium]
MNPSLEQAYVGLGPMLLEEEYMVANQKNIVNEVVKQIGLTCDALEKRENLPRNNQNFAPHHVISIIGGRGTGKTSVVTTIAEQVKKDVNKAFVIDLISPDQLSLKFPVSANIVYAVERSLEKQEKWGIIEKKIPDEKERKFRPVSWAVEIAETFDVLSRDSINTREWHDKLFKLMVSPVDLVPDFHNWLGKILKAIDCEVCVISIDDADISVEKAEEIIETIRIYLASPLIVTLLAIDLPSLERKLRNARLAKLPPVPEYKGKEDEDRLYLGMNRGAYQSAEAKAEQEYVENLLVKVLPPATRYYLTNISKDDRLYKPFQIPGKSSQKSLFEIVSEADQKIPKDSGVPLAPLFQKYPEIFADNIRRYSNQFVQISNYCQQYITDISRVLNMSDEEKAAIVNEDRSTNTSILGEDSTIAKKDVSQESYLNFPETAEQITTSKFQMQILRPFLSEGDFAMLQSYLSIDIQQFQKIHELAMLILRRGKASFGYKNRLIYIIADKSILNSMSSALIDLLGDWMLCNGGKMEYIIDLLDVKIKTFAFLSIEIPKLLTTYFSEEKLSLIEPNLSLNQTAIDDYVGGNIVVPVNEDRLMPGYVKNFSSLGRYMTVITDINNFDRQIQINKQYVNVFRRAKKDELPQKDDLKLAVYRIFGVLATQTISHLFNLILELRYDGDVEQLFTSLPVRNLLNSTTNKNLAWLVVDVPDILDLLRQIIEREEKKVSYSQKLLALSYIADLPMKILIACIAGKNADGKRNKLLNSIWQLFDTLTDIGLIERKQKSRDVGQLKLKPSGKAAKILSELSEHYPSFNWERRWEALDVLINQTLKDAKFQTSWDSAKQPPKLWTEWADTILEGYSPENIKATDIDKDKSE